MNIAFTLLTPANTATITMTDARRERWHTCTVETLADNRAVANAILRYARQRGTWPQTIQYEIQWPEGYQSDEVRA